MQEDDPGQVNDQQFPPTIPAFERILKSLRLWKLAFGFLVLVYPLVASMWVLAEGDRARDRWESEEFQRVLDDHASSLLATRSYGSESDVGRVESQLQALAAVVAEQTKAISELKGVIQGMQMAGRRGTP